MRGYEAVAQAQLCTEKAGLALHLRKGADRNRASTGTRSKHGYQHSPRKWGVRVSGQPLPDTLTAAVPRPGPSVGRFGALPPAGSGTTAGLGPPRPQTGPALTASVRGGAPRQPGPSRRRCRASCGEKRTRLTDHRQPPGPARPRHNSEPPRPHLAARPAPGPAPPPPTSRDTDGQGHGAEAESAAAAALPPGAEAREELPGDGSGSVGGIGECPAAPGAG